MDRVTDSLTVFIQFLDNMRHSLAMLLLIFGLPSAAQMSHVSWWERHMPMPAGWSVNFVPDIQECGVQPAFTWIWGCTRPVEKTIEINQSVMQYDIDQSILDMVYVHELGHAYGYAHSPEHSAWIDTTLSSTPFPTYK